MCGCGGQAGAAVRLETDLPRAEAAEEPAAQAHLRHAEGTREIYTFLICLSTNGV